MQQKQLKTLFNSYKETHLFGRYLAPVTINALLETDPIKPFVKQIGESVNRKPIYSITLGTGSKKVLMWSQMHGNESTTTKAVFDVLKLLTANNYMSKSILEHVTICIIPILNPDGAMAYTRLNANQVDLNRDAQKRTQPESKVLRHVFDIFKPLYCFNLHGQRTMYSAGKTNKPATISFLSPAQDEARSMSSNRKVAMEIIMKMNDFLQQQIPDQVGIYDDAFNLNCVGDTFQSLGTPTILFEAGHFQNDYDREITREYIFHSLMIALSYISKNNVTGEHYENYFNIPENQKLFYDIIIRNSSDGDIGIRYEEKLVDNFIDFIPKIEKISDLSDFYGHKEIDARGHQVLAPNNTPLIEGSENDFVLINNEKFALKLKKN